MSEKNRIANRVRQFARDSQTPTPAAPEKAEALDICEPHGRLRCGECRELRGLREDLAERDRVIALLNAQLRAEKQLNAGSCPATVETSGLDVLAILRTQLSQALAQLEEAQGELQT